MSLLTGGGGRLGGRGALLLEVFVEFWDRKRPVGQHHIGKDAQGFARELAKESWNADLIDAARAGIALRSHA